MANGTLAVSQLEILTQSGTGIITVVPPATNTNRTLTLPDVTGTVAVQGGAGVGKVLQVVNATYSTQTSSTSTTYADTGLTASITPSSASSKILVLVNQNGCYNNGASEGGDISLFRGATNISKMVGRFGGEGALQTNSIGSVSTCFLDSPATTSSTTYKTQFLSNNSGSAVTLQVYSTQSVITLMEIAA
jgi:hypothetical protein